MIEREVVEAIAAAGATPLAVATVVATRGSAYRRAGARMVFAEDHYLAGSVSGGCLEGELVRTGWWHTERGATVVTYDAADEDDPVRRGTGCGGSIDIVLERVGQGRIDPLAIVARCMRDQERAAIITVMRSTDPAIAIGSYAAVHADGSIDGEIDAELARDAFEAIAQGTTRAETYDLDSGTIDVLIEALVPPPRLFVLGAGPDAVAVAVAARAVGWEVIVGAPSIRPTVRARFAQIADAVVADPLEALVQRIDAADRAAVVVINHDLDRDRACLAAALASRARYVGALGPYQRTCGMLEELALTEAIGDPRLHAPIGLQLGAETPREIALSIIAEVQAELARVEPGRLRDTAHAGIHGRTEEDRPAQTGAVAAGSLRLAGCSAA